MPFLMQISRQIGQRWPIHTGGIVLVAIVVVLMQIRADFLETTDAWTRDVRHYLVPPIAEKPADVAILYVTETDLDRLECRVPIDRHYLARKLEPLRHAGPTAIGIDILFDHQARGEDELRQTLDSMPFPVFYAWIDDEHGLRPNQANRLNDFLESRHRGLATFLVDRRDGVVRELPVPFGNDSIMPLAAALAGVVGKEPATLPHPLAYSPQMPDGQPWIASYPLNFVDRILLQDPDRFRGKMLLIGVQSPLRDMHRAPFALFGPDADGVPGVALHGHAVAQLIDGRSLTTTPLLVDLVLALLLAGIGWLISLLDIRLIVQALLALLILLLYASATVAAYALTTLFLPLVMPAMALALGLLSGALVEGRQLRRQRSRVRKTFAQYVPSQIVDQLVDMPASELLEGQRTTISCLFTDIAGFTHLSERMDPVELVSMMNRYFDGVTRIIHDHDGTVDKFIGDAVLAFFGAPLPQADHADRAVAAAIEIKSFTNTLRNQLTVGGVELGETRVGVHSGEAVIGNVGGEQRQNYTALGDAVNLASRLEGANRHLGTLICISETTNSLATSHPARPIARIVVKGRKQPIEVFEPIEILDLAPAQVARYAEAYRLLDDEGHRDTILRIFRELQDEIPEDLVIAMHLKRLQAGQAGTTIILDSK